MKSAAQYLVQMTVACMEKNSFSDTYGYLPHAASAGNCLVALLSLSSAAGTPTMSDDGSGNVWTLQKTDTNAGSGQKLMCWTCPNVSAGTRKITFTFGSSQTNYVGALFEFSDIATASPSAGTVSPGGLSSATVATTAFTPSQDNTLILQFAAQCDITGYTDQTNSFTPGTIEPNWELIHSQLLGGSASQMVIQETAASINPTMTCGASRAWNTLAIALKISAGAGTSLATLTATKALRVRRRIFHSYLSSAISTFTLQQPDIGGGALVLAYHGYDSVAVDHDVRSIVSASGKAQIKGTAAGHFSAGNNVNSSIWYDPTMDGAHSLLTLTTNNAVSELTVCMREIIGLNPSSPLGATFTNSGTETSTTSLECGSITPTRKGSIIIAIAPLDSGTAKQTLTPDTASSDYWSSTNMGGNGFDTTEEDNGQAFYIVPGGPTDMASSGIAAVDWKWTVDTTNTAVPHQVGNWDISVAEFVPPVPTYRHRTAHAAPGG